MASVITFTSPSRHDQPDVREMLEASRDAKFQIGDHVEVTRDFGRGAIIPGRIVKIGEEMGETVYDILPDGRAAYWLSSRPNLIWAYSWQLRLIPVPAPASTVMGA